MTTSEATRPRSLRPLLVTSILLTVVALLVGVPWWTLVASPHWPAPVLLPASALFAAVAVALPLLMFLGHARGRGDSLTIVADVLLGVVWVLFTWSVIGNVLRLVLSARIVAVGVLAVSVVLLAWGFHEAMRVPRVREVPITLPRLGPGLDGTRVVLLTDTHYGPIDRSRWSRGVTKVVNSLGADIVCHTGDIADGTVDQRREQSAPLGEVEAGLARVYVTGNHEYYGDALGWLARMDELGWTLLHNTHVIVERGGDRLVLAGIDDATAHHSGHPGHRADLDVALTGADPELPVLLLAHQPKQIGKAEAAGVDLQLSGHTHGGQMWPFTHLVKIDQPSVQGLERRTERTQLYTSRGTGFWGPPFRVFAPSEITLITLRSPAS
ncbi:metallophosphoesterase [Actinocorallia longicatena]|uniref:Metallophosphoesterase n=1 Tax=Actinocorallia longicatena TaxID=111803 RepID=A0ABP6QNM8_9ACTN